MIVYICLLIIKNTKIKHNMDHNKLINQIELDNIVFKNKSLDKLFIIKIKMIIIMIIVRYLH